MMALRSIHGGIPEHLEPVLRALSASVDSSHCDATPPQQEALSILADHVAPPGAGAGLLTGDSGSGKSLLISLLASRLERAGTPVAVVETGLLGFEDLLLELSSQIAGERYESAGRPALYDRFALFKNMLVERVIARGQRLVVFFDDADSLTPDTLSGIASLINLRSAGRDHVVPVLVGSPALPRHLSACPLMASRVTTVAHVRPLLDEEVSGYLKLRLALGGVDPSDVFEPSALNQLHSIAGRTPRRIDSVCRGAARRAIHQRRRASIDDLSATAAALPDGPADLRSTAFGR